MRYLTLSADYDEPSVRDERLGKVRIEDEGLPKELVDDLLTWYARYQPIVSADMRERAAEETAALIGDLDRLGLPWPTVSQLPSRVA